MTHRRALSWRRRLLALVFSIAAVGLVTPYLGFRTGAMLVLGMPAAMVWVLVCLAAVFFAQLLVYLEDAGPLTGESLHPWERELEERHAHSAEKATRDEAEEGD